MKSEMTDVFNAHYHFQDQGTPKQDKPKGKTMKIMLVGGGGREHAIAQALRENPATELITIMSNASPGLIQLSHNWEHHHEMDLPWIVEFACRNKVDFAVVGFEDPLALGICDELEAVGVKCLGPNKAGAQLEASKIFARDLMRKHDIPGQVEYHLFEDTSVLAEFLQKTKKEFAIKPIGLSAGKGVKVMGDQLKTIDEAIEYGSAVISRKIGGTAAVLLEERLTGEEFTLQCFVDGKTVSPMPAVQDYKRAYEGNLGPNTGGMGSYSQPDGLLPFLNRTDYKNATEIIRRTVAALRKDGIIYKGILYGQFMMTEVGPKVIEFNARFGDPEAMNVLALLETDLVEVFQAIINRSEEHTSELQSLQ